VTADDGHDQEGADHGLVEQVDDYDQQFMTVFGAAGNEVGCVHDQRADLVEKLEQVDGQCDHQTGVHGVESPAGLEHQAVEQAVLVDARLRLIRLP